MNAKEAREIVRGEKAVYGLELAALRHAEGYLACLEGPEVKALIEVAETMIEVCFENKTTGKNFDKWDHPAWASHYKKALKALGPFRRAGKP